MKNKARLWCSLGVALSLAALSGCQTWVGGMTLPSGYYLQHPPQYFPPSPPFPLARELATMETNYAAAPPAGGPAPPAAPAVPVP